MYKLFIITLLITSLLQAKILDYDIVPSKIKQNIKIKILDSKELKFKGINEISALAINGDTLFALSDKSDLYTFKIKIKKDKIKKLKLKKSLKLRDEKSKKLSKKNSDSEGMILINNELLISFEKNHRIESYTLDGKKVKKYKLNKKLRDTKNYKSENKGLEALAYNEKYGLITAPEVPVKDKKHHTLYSKNKEYKFKQSGDIKGLEFINEGKLLVMQRNYDSKKDEINIIFNNVDLSTSNANNICKSETLAKLKSKDGWKLYNFEGLTKVSKNRFLMISDNHGEKSQKTFLVFFEIK